MAPDVELRHYVNTDQWAVFVYHRGDLAACPTAAAAVAAMRLIGGDDSVDQCARYLRSIGCTPGHAVLDALEGR